MASDAEKNALIAALHAVPRYDSALARAPSDFSLPEEQTAKAYAASPYLQGVLLQAGGVWALAALFAAVFGLVFAAACCCRRRLAKPRGGAGDGPSAYARGVACCCSGRNCYFVAATAFACGLAAALAYTTTFFAGVGDLLAGLGALRATLGAVGATVGGALLGNLTAVDALALQAQALAAGTPLAPDADALAASSAAAVAFATAVAAQLNATSSLLAQDLGIAVGAGAAGVPAAAQALVPGRIDLGAARYGLTDGSLALLSCALAWLALQACLLRATPCAAGCFRAAAFPTLLLAVLITVLAGIAYLPALVGSDVCFAPAAAVTAVLNATAGVLGDDAAATFGYYATCAGAQPPLAPSGALAQALGAQVQLAAAQAQLAALADGGAGANASFAPILAGLNASLALSDAALAGLVSQVQCAPIASEWELALRGLCLGAVFGVDALAVSLGAGAALLFVMLCATAHMLLHHPGDLAADAAAFSKEGERESLRGVERALRTVALADEDLATGGERSYRAPAALGAARVRSAAAASAPPPGAYLARGAAPTYQGIADYR